MTLPDRGRYLITGGHVLTMDEALGDLPVGDVLVGDGTILAVGPDLAADPRAAGAEVIDGRRMIVLPGFVATHEHLWAALQRGIAGDEPPRDSWSVKELLAPHLTPAETAVSVRLACAEAIAAGITSTISWAHNWMEPEEADANVEALVESGIRARYAPGAPSTKWGLSLEEMAAVMARVGRRVDEPMDVDDLARIRREWFDADRVDGRVRLGVSVRGPSRSTEPVYRAEFAAARDLGLPIYMHCAGTTAETAKIRQATILSDAGLLGPDLSFAHGMQLSAFELDAMAEHGVDLAVTPVSELRLELGYPLIGECRARGITVGLGFDNPAYSATMDMFATMRLALGLERTRQGRLDALTPRETLAMATIDGARYLDLDDVAGSLRAGKRADLILVRRDDLNMAPAGDPVTALVFSAQPANVDTVLVDGRILQRGGRLTAVDPAALVAEADAALRATCARAGLSHLLA